MPILTVSRDTPCGELELDIPSFTVNGVKPERQLDLDIYRLDNAFFFSKLLSDGRTAWRLAPMGGDFGEAVWRLDIGSGINKGTAGKNPARTIPAALERAMKGAQGSGSRSFFVRLNGQDAILKLGEIAVSIINNEAVVNGRESKFGHYRIFNPSARKPKSADDRWEIAWNYEDVAKPDIDPESESGAEISSESADLNAVADPEPEIQSGKVRSLKKRIAGLANMFLSGGKEGHDDMAANPEPVVRIDADSVHESVAKADEPAHAYPEKKAGAQHEESFTEAGTEQIDEEHEGDIVMAIVRKPPETGDLERVRRNYDLAIDFAGLDGSARIDGCLCRLDKTGPSFDDAGQLKNLSGSLDEDGIHHLCFESDMPIIPLFLQTANGSVSGRLQDGRLVLDNNPAQGGLKGRFMFNYDAHMDLMIGDRQPEVSKDGLLRFTFSEGRLLISPEGRIRSYEFVVASKSRNRTFSRKVKMGGYHLDLGDPRNNIEEEVELDISQIILPKIRLVSAKKP